MSKRTKLTPLQKILLVKGGLVHRTYRQGKSQFKGVPRKVRREKDDA